MMPQRIIEVQEKIDLSPFLQGEQELISARIERDGISSLVICTEPQYRRKDGFPAIYSEELQDFIFIKHSLNGKLLFQTRIENQMLNYHFAHSLPDGEILLVCARCGYYEDGTADKNACIYDKQGNLVREFVLGDGINEVLVDGQGNIWAGYFDEGIFGNFGWNNPLGASGLVCWDRLGNKIWEFEPKGELGSISDCYALNLDKHDNVWLCYYTDFPLVCIDPQKRMQYWRTEKSGSRCIHVHNNRILMEEGYRAEGFVLFDLDKNQLKRKQNIHFTTPNGLSLASKPLRSFGWNIGFLQDQKIYLTSLRAIH